MTRNEYDAIRAALLTIGHWSKAHYKERFSGVRFGQLFTLADYMQMIGYFTTQVEHKRNNEGRQAEKGYAPTYAKRFRNAFRRLREYALD